MFSETGSFWLGFRAQSLLGDGRKAVLPKSSSLKGSLALHIDFVIGAVLPELLLRQVHTLWVARGALHQKETMNSSY